MRGEPRPPKRTDPESNDHSYDITKTALADWNKVTLYRNGALIWGTEP